MRAARCEIQGQLIQNDGKLLRATNPEERATAHSSDSDAASPQQTQTDNDASGSPQRVAGRPPLPSVRVTILHLKDQNGLGRPLRMRLRRDEFMK